MCGIYGVIGQGIIKEDIEVFYELGVTNIVRGKDASGMVFGNTRTNKELTSTKTRGDFLSLYYSFCNDAVKVREFDSIMNTMYLGHNRHTTVGSSIAKAAHPYGFKNFIGMHNGTIQSSHIRDLVTENDGKDGGYLTDSQALLSLVERDGLDKTLCSLNDAKDAYALVIWDKLDKKIKIVRNSKRPLMFAVNKLRGVMYYSSEEGALDYILGRNGIKYRKWEPDERMVFTIDPVKIATKGDRSWEAYELGESTYVEPEKVTPDNDDKGYFIWDGNVRREVSKEEWERQSLTV